GLVQDHEADAERGHPLVDAPLARVAGADDRHGRSLDGHASAHLGSSTGLDRSGGESASPRPAFVLLSSTLSIGACSSASSRTVPSSRSTVVSFSVVTVAFRGALSSSPRSPKLLPGPLCASTAPSRWTTTLPSTTA